MQESSSSSSSCSFSSSSSSTTYEKRNDERIKNVEHLFVAPIVENYIKMIAPVSEAPLEFHILTMLFTISSIMGRNFYIQQGQDTYFPNLYVLMLGASGEFHKTSAIYPFRDMVEKVGCMNRYLGMIGSPEGLLNALQGDECNGTGYLYYSEFGDFISSLKKGFFSNAKDILTDAYDCRHIKKKLKNEEYNVLKPYLNILGASQLHSLNKDISESELMTGFVPRFYICFTKTLPLDIYWRDEVDPNRDRDIINMLKEIRSFVKKIEESRFEQEPEERTLEEELDDMVDPQDRRVIVNNEIKFKVSEEAKEYWIDQCKKLRVLRRKGKPKMIPMYVRAEAMILKFAMIIHIANLRFDDFTITLDTMKKAMRVVAYSIKNYIQVFTKELQFTEYGKIEIRIINMLQAQKKLTVREIMRDCIGKGTRAQCLNTMDQLVKDDICKPLYTKKKNKETGEVEDYINSYQYIKPIKVS